MSLFLVLYISILIIETSCIILFVSCYMFGVWYICLLNHPHVHGRMCCSKKILQPSTDSQNLSSTQSTTAESALLVIGKATVKPISCKLGQAAKSCDQAFTNMAMILYYRLWQFNIKSQFVDNFHLDCYCSWRRVLWIIIFSKSECFVNRFVAKIRLPQA